MTHTDEGRLLALVDGELAPDEARRVRDHVDGCEPCGRALETLRESRTAVTAALAPLDPPAPAERVRRRIGRASLRPAVDQPAVGGHPAEVAGAARRSWTLPAALPRAAAVALLFGAAAVAAAVPGSPVREWVTGLGAPEDPVVESPEAASAADTPMEVGVRVAPADGRVRISVSGVRPGTVVDVRWVERDRAAVYAPEGTRFSTGAGFLSAAVEPGPLRVELPRDAARVSLAVDGETWLEKTGEGIATPGPAAREVDGGFRFVAP